MLRDADLLFAYEAGELDESQTIALFQQLIDSGLAWELQGSYGRTAMAVLRSGLCTGEIRGRDHGEQSTNFARGVQ